MPIPKAYNTYRSLHPGMGQAVAERTILRKKIDGKWETWGDVADRVALGNSLLCIDEDEQKPEYFSMKKHLSKATLLMSGRHLQHGDRYQPQRNMEIFTNCATSASSFILFYLLLNGCFRKGTKVKMANGTYKNIEDVKENDMVVSFDENTGEFVDQRVSRLNINQPKPMVKVVLENGEEIVCTEDHKFLTKDGEWIQAKDLNGKILKMQKNQEPWKPSKPDKWRYTFNKGEIHKKKYVWTNEKGYIFSRLEKECGFYKKTDNGIEANIYQIVNNELSIISIGLYENFTEVENEIKKNQDSEFLLVAEEIM